MLFTCVLWNLWELFVVSHPVEVLLWPLHIAKNVVPMVRKATIPIDLVLGAVCWIRWLAVFWKLLSLSVFCIVPCRGWLLSSELLWGVIRLMLWGVRISLCVFLRQFSSWEVWNEGVSPILCLTLSCPRDIFKPRSEDHTVTGSKPVSGNTPFFFSSTSQSLGSSAWNLRGLGCGTM